MHLSRDVATVQSWGRGLRKDPRARPKRNIFYGKQPMLQGSPDDKFKQSIKCHILHVQGTMANTDIELIVGTPQNGTLCEFKGRPLP